MGPMTAIKAAAGTMAEGAFPKAATPDSTIVKVEKKDEKEIDVNSAPFST